MINESDALITPYDPVASSSPVRRIRNWHPACERTAIGFARSLTSEFTKGMSKAERVRHSQALAYLAYRDDNQTSVSIAQLASDIRVPEHRLSKDIKAVAAKLGIRGWLTDVDDDDDDVFARAMLAVLKPGFMAKGVTVRSVNRWCRDLFLRATCAGEVGVANMAPKHQADAALAIYCEQMGSPFSAGAFGPAKRGRDGALENDKDVAVRVLTRNTTVRKAAIVLRKHV
jgi:hypothetical protein